MEICERGDYSDFDKQSQIIIGDEMRICAVHSYDVEGEANARLIAAAPEMLEVLIEFCKVNCTECNIVCGTHCALYDSKTVIERATGLKIEEVLTCTE